MEQNTRVKTINCNCHHRISNIRWCWFYKSHLYAEDIFLRKYLTKSGRSVLKSWRHYRFLFGDLQSPLHLATYLNLTQVVRELVEKGVSLELQDHDGNTALHVACQQGQVETASEMTKHMSPSKLAPVFETQNWKGEKTKFSRTSLTKVCHLKSLWFVCRSCLSSPGCTEQATSDYIWPGKKRSKPEYSGQFRKPDSHLLCPVFWTLLWLPSPDWPLRR